MDVDMPPQIRSALGSDLPDLLRLNDQVQHHHAEQYPDRFKYPIHSGDVVAFFRGLIGHASHEVLVAELNGRVVGYLWYEVQERAENLFKLARRLLYVHHVCVDVNARRRGIAASLLERADDRARDEQIVEIVVDTWSLNRMGQVFFKSQGFETARIILAKNLRSTNDRL